MGEKCDHLVMEDREMIAVMKAEGRSFREIGEAIGKDKSTISRELRRNAPPQNKGYYLGHKAHQRAQERKSWSCKRERLKGSEVREYVEEHLKEGWSPEMISGRIKVDKPSMAISHEAIYQYLYSERRELIPYLVRQHKKRQKRGYSRRHKKAHIPNRISISERPAIIGKRERLGDWEADCVVSRKSRQSLNVLVERVSRMTRITKLSQKTAAQTTVAIKNALCIYPHEVCCTITYDNGSENSEHEAVNEALGTASYFCNPYHSWEKGSVENRIGVIRRRLPKGTDFGKVSDEIIREIENWLNNQPMKCLKYKKPIEVFYELCYKNN